MSKAPATRVTDQFAHSSALSGVLTGLLVGVAVVAAGAFIVGTGGLGAIAIGGAIATVGGAGLAGQAIGSTVMGPPTGAIATGSPNVLTNNLPQAATVIGIGPCAKEGGTPQQVATGVANVLINRQPAARQGETMTCSAKIISGSPNVVIRGDSVQMLPIEPEVPTWLSNTMLAMTIGGGAIAFGGAVAAYGAVVATGSAIGGGAGSYLLGEGMQWGAGQMGFGETGQVVAGVVGNFAGGALGGGAAFKRSMSAMQASRQATASRFYADQGMPAKDIPDHLKGIDFNRPITTTTLPKGTQVTQYQVPGGRQGNYYAPPGTPASQLGINPQGVSRTTGAVVDKTPTTFTTTRDVSVLRSTAASVDDTWSVPGSPYRADGGGTQFFTGDKGAFGP